MSAHFEKGGPHFTPFTKDVLSHRLPSITKLPQGQVPKTSIAIAS